MALPEYPTMSVEDYLILDRNSKSARYEYLDGELKMLAGGSLYHSIIIANLTGILTRLLEDGPCWTYNSDAWVQLSPSRYVYPDVTISCDQRDLEPGDMVRYPRVVIEVLSPSTEVVDRVKKFVCYRECPTIQDYVMVDSQSILVEVYHRESEDTWLLSTYGPGSEIKIESLSIQFSIDAIYRRLKLTGTRRNANEP